MTTNNTMALTLEGKYYTSADIFRQEHERIFGGHWICVGRSAEIARPGQYLLVSLGDESLIVVRDQQGQARAFHNICRHRGTRMCTEERGQFAGSIQCPYHAWTYGLDGRLLAARYMGEVPGFEKADWPLLPAALLEWQGFLMLNLAADPEPLTASLIQLDQKLAPWALPALVAAKRIEYEVAANWKLIVQNYSECYHCPLIHPALEKLSPSRMGDNDLLHGEVLGGYMVLSQSAESMTIHGQTSRPPLGSVAGDDLSRVYYYAIFPNLLLSLHADYVMTHTLWPLSPGRTRIVNEFLFEPATITRLDFDPQDAVEFWDMTNRQDWHVCELSQLGVASKAYVPGPYAGGEEEILALWDQEYVRALLDA
jgi:Rieske 2Fe-2S family protein